MRAPTAKVGPYIIVCICLAILCSAAAAQNIALGKVTSANSVYSTAYSSRVVDGDRMTSWAATHHASPTDPLWVKVDLGALYAIDRIIAVGPQSPYTGYTVIYDLLVSTDDVHWTNLRHGIHVDGIDFIHNICASGRSIRYVKYEAVGGSHWAQLWELEVYPVSTQTSSVALINPTATFSQSYNSNFLVGYTVDGTTTGGNGWALARNEQTFCEADTAVYETAEDAGSSKGTLLTLRLQQNYGYGHVIGRFRLSVTTANRSRFADGLATGGNVGPDAIWTVLTPSECASANGQTMTVLPDRSVLVSGPRPDTDVYTITARIGVTGITGVRLELLKDTSLPYGGPGRGWNGNPVLTEIEMEVTALDMRTVNAVGRSLGEPIVASASSSFRFATMGQVTVLDGDSLLIDGVKVIAPNHSGLSTGQYARATGWPVQLDGSVALVCSRDEILRIE